LQHTLSWTKAGQLYHMQFYKYSAIFNGKEHYNVCAPRWGCQPNALIAELEHEAISCIAALSGWDVSPIQVTTISCLLIITCN